MKGSTSILLTLVLIAAFVLVSCAPTAAPTAAPEAAAPTKAPEATKAPAPKATEVPKAAPKTKITLWHGWKETEIVALNAVIAAFQQSNPDAEFEVLYVPFDDLRGKFETAAATGGGPTVLIGAADWGPALFDAELVADVGDMAGALLTKSINEAALGAVQYKGKLIGLPQTIKGVVMFRNAAIIERAPATYTDLIAAARGATRGDVVGADLERGFFFSAAHLFGLGGTLLDADGNPAFNNEAGVRWVSVLKSLADCDQLLCLGDLCAPFTAAQIEQAFPGPLHLVWGNNDGDREHIAAKLAHRGNAHLHDEFAELELDGLRLALTHYPHLATALAAGQQYDLVCHGHNHQRQQRVVGRTLVVNPGEVMGRFGVVSCAVYDTVARTAELLELGSPR
jgi:hypothetical protein